MSHFVDVYRRHAEIFGDRIHQVSRQKALILMLRATSDCNTAERLCSGGKRDTQ